MELIKAYLEYQELKKQQIVRKNPRYKIRIELDVVSSNSEEYSDEDDADDENDTESSLSDFLSEDFEEIEKIVRIKKCFNKLKFRNL